MAARIAEGQNREGIALALLLPPMALSGYALQTRFGESWRTGWIWIHGLSGSLWLLAYGIHQVEPARSPARGSASEHEQEPLERTLPML